MYWRPKPEYPASNELHKVSIPAGKTRTLTYYVDKRQTMKIYSMNDDDITFGLFYSKEKVGYCKKARNNPFRKRLTARWRHRSPPFPNAGYRLWTISITSVKSPAIIM